MRIYSTTTLIKGYGLWFCTEEPRCDKLESFFTLKATSKILENKGICVLGLERIKNGGLREKNYLDMFPGVGDGERTVLLYYIKYNPSEGFSLLRWSF